MRPILLYKIQRMVFYACPILVHFFALTLAEAQDIPSPRQTPQRYEYTHPQMGTVFKILVYATDSLLAQTATRAAFNRVDTLNAHLSDYLPESELNQLCAKAGTRAKVGVGADLWAILRLSHRFSQQSEGAFDATIGPLTRLWRRARNLKSLPDSARIAAAQNLTNYQFLHFYKKKHRIRMEKPGMQLDLGGIAQGYAADACLQVLYRYGLKQALVDAGGDIALGDPPPRKEGWDIDIPGAEGGKQTLHLSNCGITTSGASFRFLEVGGVRYSHIVDPRTGWGLTHRVLVTVQAPTGVEADAWATALSVMGAKDWQKIKHKHPRLKVWLTETRL